MATLVEKHVAHHASGAIAWLPLATLPVVLAAWLADGPAWVMAWSLAAAVYAGLKWLTFAGDAAAWQAPLGRAMGYLALWPGMDPAEFFASSKGAPKPAAKEWIVALAQLAAGLLLFFLAAPAALPSAPWVAGWLGMGGVMLTLLFGVPHLAALAWRRAGVEVAPIMNAPLRADSLSDFWGRRWNLAFRDALHVHVFRPLRRRAGPAWASLAVFAFSGLIHDLVMSIPARGGWGLPTLYFLAQGGGMLLERSRLGKSLGLSRGALGRIYAAIVILAPLGLLFHRPFLEHAILPLIEALRGA